MRFAAFFGVFFIALPAPAMVVAVILGQEAIGRKRTLFPSCGLACSGSRGRLALACRGGLLGRARSRCGGAARRGPAPAPAARPARPFCRPGGGPAAPVLAALVVVVR